MASLPSSSTPVQSAEERVVELVLSGKNVCISGGGGTGKSWVSCAVADLLTNLDIKVYKTGSTGVAADRIGGMTLHSYSGIGMCDKSLEYYLMNIKSNMKAVKRLITTDVLIIDEISMTGMKVFEMASEMAKSVRNDPRPFGGLRVIVAGDFLQLPPVKDQYVFLGSVWEEMKFHYIELTHPHRFMNDLEFFEILSRVRKQQHTDDDVKVLQTRMKAFYTEKPDQIEEGSARIVPTRLFSKKIDVLAENLAKLAQLPGQEYKFCCEDSFDKLDKRSRVTIETYQQMMDKIVHPVLHLKVGAQVMLTWNLDVEAGLCNGSRGVVLEVKDDSDVLVRFKKGDIIISPNTWTIKDDDVFFTRTQIPLILAWSITIHKSQSATLDSVIIDLGTSIFSPNMAYVALSRAKTLSSIYLNNLIPKKLYCDPVALEFQTMIESVAEKF